VTPADVERLTRFLESSGWSHRKFAREAGIDKNVLIRLLKSPEKARHIESRNSEAILAVMDDRRAHGAAPRARNSFSSWNELPPVVSFFELFPEDIDNADVWFTCSNTSHTYFEPEPMRKWHQFSAYERTGLSLEKAMELVAAEGAHKPAIRQCHESLTFRHQLVLQASYISDAFRRNADWADALVDEIQDLQGHTAVSFMPNLDAWNVIRSRIGEAVGIGPASNVEVIGDSILIARPFEGHNQIYTRDPERIKAVRAQLESAVEDAPRCRTDEAIKNIARKRPSPR